ncbi:unnamed protein product [Pylaiella littoralis]
MGFVSPAPLLSWSHLVGGHARILSLCANHSSRNANGTDGGGGGGSKTHEERGRRWDERPAAQTRGVGAATPAAAAVGAGHHRRSNATRSEEIADRLAP